MSRKPTGFAWPAVGHRGRRILHAGSWSLIAKAAAAANLFVAVPFVLAALGPARFGAWATLVSLVVFAGFLDFGMSNGAMNLVAGAHGRNAPGEVRAILREARIALNRTAIGLGALALIVIALVPWSRVLGMDDAHAGESRAAVAIVLATIVLSVPLNLANRAQLGFGRGDRTFRWQAFGQIVALALTVILSKTGTSLVALTAAAVATPMLASVANTILLWRELRRDAPAAMDTEVDHSALRHTIGREGLSFFGLQLAAALAFSADLPLISMLHGPTEAGAYAIVQRLFSAIPLCLGLVWAPLWPIYRQALAAGDTGWVQRTFRRSLIGALVFASATASVLAFGFDTIVMHWVRAPVVVPALLLAGFATWCLVEAGGTALSTLLNAGSVLRYQLYTSCSFAILCIVGKMWAITHNQIPLMPWMTVASYLSVNIVGLIWLGRRVFADMYAKVY